MYWGLRSHKCIYIVRELSKTLLSDGEVQTRTGRCQAAPDPMRLHCWGVERKESIRRSRSPRKLDAEISEGRKHTVVVAGINGTNVGWFGVRRNKQVGHGYIPKQIQVTMEEALGLARCNLYKADYESILRARGKLPADSSTPV